MNIVIFGLSLSSSWGNGHAVTFRSLIKGLHAAGHDVTFFERDVEWYASHRDFSEWPFSTLVFYERISELAAWRDTIRNADAVIIGSYVPDAGILYRIARDLTPNIVALYDIDTPVTVADLRQGRHNVFDRAMIADCDLYLTFTGGPMLRTIASEFHARLVRPLYCSVDPDLHRPMARRAHYALSYLGTYSADRQPSLERYLLRVAQAMPEQQFIVGGAQFPQEMIWPENVVHRDHVPPSEHPSFYADSVATLNITRADMIAAGYSPSIRLFEAASCATTILTDTWPGLSDFLTPAEECITVDTTEDVIEALRRPESDLRKIAEAARERTLSQHTGTVRALELIEALEDTRSLPCGNDRTAQRSEPIPGIHVE